MKMELPFAVALIACGSLLWTTRAPAERQDQQTVGPPPSIATAVDAPDPQISDLSPGFQPPQVPAAPPSAANQLPAASQQINHLPAPPAAPQVNSDSRQQSGHQNLLTASGRSLESQSLLQQSARLLTESPPIQTRAKMMINQFGQALEVQGRYLQQGQGTRRARFDFQYQDEDTRFQVMQMCDGRFFYSLSAINDRSSLEFVDLQSVADTSSGPLSFSAGPTGWISTGGISSLLDHLSVAFDFQPPNSAEIAGIPMVTVRGQWNKKALETLLTGQVDPKAFTSGPNGGIDWDKIPDQIPHTVEIMLGKDSYLHLFPYRVQFNQYRHPVEADGPSQKWVSKSMVSLELFEVTKVADIPLEDFRIDTQQLEPINATEKYTQRVKDFEHYETLQRKAKQDQSALNKPASGPATQSARVPVIPTSRNK